MPESFSQILARIGRTDKNTDHTYGPIYDLWFAPYRQTAKSVLEVGVCFFGGGGFLALHKYFADAVVWGIDVDTEPCCEAAAETSNLLKMDAYGDEFDEWIKDKTFDVIIDDCLHDMEHQWSLFRRLSPHLSPGGMYVIEDGLAGDWVRMSQELWSQGFGRVVVDMSTESRADNVLVQIRRTAE